MIGAVDIGGTKIAVALIGDSGQVLARAESATRAGRGPAEGLARITAMLHGLTAQAGVSLAGIGVGCTGPVDALAGTLGRIPFLPGWEGLDLARQLSDAWRLPVALENDADAAALGEGTWGAGRGARNFICVTVGTGIGGGLVLGGRLYRGQDGLHPEIGHHVIDPSGPACSCGARGCWESLASGPALADWYSAATGESVDAAAICARAEQGDGRAGEAVAREGRWLGLGLANLIPLFVPDVIALGGGVMRSRHLFWDEMQATIRAACRLIPAEKVRLLPAALGSDAGLIGAACAWTHRFHSPP